jgi:hypothetical protein
MHPAATLPEMASFFGTWLLLDTRTLLLLPWSETGLRRLRRHRCVSRSSTGKCAPPVAHIDRVLPFLHSCTAAHRNGGGTKRYHHLPISASPSRVNEHQNHRTRSPPENRVLLHEYMSPWACHMLELVPTCSAACMCACVLTQTRSTAVWAGRTGLHSKMTDTATEVFGSNLNIENILQIYDARPESDISLDV